MYLSVSRYLSCVVCLSVCLLTAAHAQGALVISNLQVTTSSLSFDLSGTIGEGMIAEGANGKSLLFIGEPGNSDWYEALSVTNNTLSGDWSPALGTVDMISPELTESATFGDYILLVKSGGDFAINDAIDGSFEVQSDDLFRPEDTDLNEWIISIGYINLSFPDLATQVGSAAPSPAPEPSSGILVAFALPWLASRRRR